MEIWPWRRLLVFGWTELKSNTERLKRVGEQIILLAIIKEKSGKMFSHQHN